MKRPIKQESVTLNKNLDDQSFRDDSYRLLQSLNLKPTTLDYTASREFNNSALLTNGDHKGFILKRDDFIDGIPGATLPVDINISVPCRINNIYFSGTVTLKDGASVIFTGCRFDKVINVEPNGKSHFNSCFFKNGCYINNGGVIQNIYVSSCFRSAVIHNNVTIISEIVE